jgi:hypothetical protein
MIGALAATLPLPKRAGERAQPAEEHEIHQCAIIPR